jgi:hypothetical protein
VRRLPPKRIVLAMTARVYDPDAHAGWTEAETQPKKPA